MSFSLLQSGSSKESIINLLSERFPLSVKEIHSALLRSYGLSVSYQAVHKAVLLMVEEGVIAKIEGKYQLDKRWIKNVKNFGEHLEQLYSSEHKIKEFSLGEVINLSFERFADFGRFIIFTFHDQFPNPENKAGLYFLEHAWATAGFDEPEVEKLKEVYAKTQNYLVVRNASPLDQYFIQAYRALGKHCFVGVDFPVSGELMVSGDYICQHFFTTEFKNKYYSFYEKTESINQLNSLDIVNLYYERQPVRVVITKNPELADSLRLWVLELEKKRAK